jgi:hypothetical protein
VLKKILKWAALLILVVAVGGFLAFLYFIPPFFTQPPETFTAEMRSAAPPVAAISDPKERAIAERGREIVMRTGCVGCHAYPGPQGPDFSKYLGGGSLKFVTAHGSYVVRNLTPDDTGLAGRTDEDVKRVLRSGVFPDGRVVPYTVMPWANFSNWTDEDRHAVVVYLRHIPPIKHRTPENPVAGETLPSSVVERTYGGNYGTVH